VWRRGLCRVLVIDEAARCIDVSCGDDDGVGKGESVGKIWRWSLRGRRGKTGWL
jgi:hypothetical protein